MTPGQLTLPISYPDLIILLSATTAVTMLFWNHWQSSPQKASSRWPGPKGWVTELLRLPLFLLAALWLGLFVLTLWASYLGVWAMIQPPAGTGQPQGASGQMNLGIGALLAALLGAPFVIWGTWLKYQTVRFQKEGHMTDRINTAVEQLGAEKTVKVPGKDANGKDITIEETRPNIEVRIGAILSLERIAQDSTLHDKGRDHVRVMEILCAYVLENSTARKLENFPEPDWEPLKDDATAAEREEQLEARVARFGRGYWESKAWIRGKELKEPRADIVQALQVIGRRTAQQRRVEAAWPEAPEDSTIWPFDLPCPHLPDQPGEAPLGREVIKAFQTQLAAWRERILAYKGYRLNLQGANLQGAKLSPERPDASDAVFAGAILTGARMEGANLDLARMEGANLDRARMEGGLYGARMEGASLDGARLEGASLWRARLEGASLYRARMEGASLYQARMEGASLDEARLEGARLNATRMEGARLYEARLEGARLNATRTEGASLYQARMEGARLYEARLEGANLDRAQFDASTSLEGAMFHAASAMRVDFTSTSISQDQVNSLFGDASTELPDTIPRPDHWPDWELPRGGEHAFNDEWKKWRDDPAGYVPPKAPKTGAGKKEAG